MPNILTIRFSYPNVGNARAEAYSDISDAVQDGVDTINEFFKYSTPLNAAYKNTGRDFDTDLESFKTNNSFTVNQDDVILEIKITQVEDSQSETFIENFYSVP